MLKVDRSMRTILVVAAALLAVGCQPEPERVSPEQGSENQDMLETESLPTHPASERGEPIPAVDAAEYVLLSSEKLGNGNVVALSRRHSAKSGTSYSLREYQCDKGMFRYLGSGDKREDAEKVRFENDPFGKLVNGSSAFLTGQVACAKYGATLVAPIN